MKIDRRSLIVGGSALAASACVPLQTDLSGRLAAKLRIIEATSSGGTLGAWFHDTGNGAGFGHRADERFAHCSSFKFSLAGWMLAEAEKGSIDPDETVRWSEADLLSYAPFAREHLATGASWRELARAAQTLSDNTAANLLLRRLGGPEGLTAWWRSLGDMQSRLDRYEPELNNVPPGEVRDTTTPRAMAQTVATILFGGVLGADARNALRQWTSDTQTGIRRTRGGLPASWAKGDKTGTSIWPGQPSHYVDIGWFTPPGRAPITYATYFRSKEQQLKIDPASEDILRQAGATGAEFAQALFA